MNPKSVFLSHTLNENTPSYGNRDAFYIRVNASIPSGASANSSSWYFSNNHIGTHIDTPKHFCNKGKSLSELSADELVFYKVCIIDVPFSSGRLLTVDDIIQHDAIIAEDVELLLIRTGYEAYRSIDKYWNDNPGIASSLAEYLRDKYLLLRGIGFDFISLTSWNHRDEGKKSHRTFLCPEKNKRPLYIIEDMALELAGNEILAVIIAPLIVENENGGPVTIIAQIA